MDKRTKKEKLKKYDILVMGINLSHDRSVAILKNGKIVVAIEEERLDHSKHSPGIAVSDNNKIIKLIPYQSITYCLDYLSIGIDDLDLIIFNKALDSINVDQLRRTLPIKDKNKVALLDSHHLCHAYSTYFSSGFSESIVFVQDSFGSIDRSTGKIESVSFYLASKNKIKPLEVYYRDFESEINLCCYYDFVSLYLGFFNKKISSMPNLSSKGLLLIEGGKTMGLAAFGKYNPKLPEVLIDNDKSMSFELELLFNLIEYVKGNAILKGKRYNNPLYRDMAFKTQNDLCNGTIYLLNKIFNKTKCTNLCIGGGAGLNILLNSEIYKKTNFKDIFVLPAPIDSGNAFGCAYYGYYSILKEKFMPRQIPHVFTGKTYNEKEIENALKKFEKEINIKKLNFEELLELVADYISKDFFVGWFQANSEFGPRALGHRSILGNPCNKKTKIMLNRKVKHREQFRPFALSIIEEKLDQYVSLPDKKTSLAKFMLIAGKVIPEKRKIIPSVIHADNTARVHAVSRKIDPIFYNLLLSVEKKIGVPLLLNTSFNNRGMPIVEKPEDAIFSFLKTKLDYLVIGEYILEKTNAQ